MSGMMEPKDSQNYTVVENIVLQKEQKEMKALLANRVRWYLFVDGLCSQAEQDDVDDDNIKINPWKPELRLQNLIILKITGISG